ncbi:MAG TPA: C25 family cysteine peptidase [Candidatus Krumholzibacteria bacterium]|nr:C25 family cysteine peptidase [Candidatus Krumholzibacteria bacterium]
MIRTVRARGVRLAALALACLPAAGRAALAAPSGSPSRESVTPSVAVARTDAPTPVVRARLAPLRLAGSPLGPFQPTEAPSLEGSPVEYLIVTSQAMAGEFARLAAWKTAKGVPAVVRTVTEVRAAAVQGCDFAETLRNYLRDAYQLWGVRFVLLAGDTDIIPARYVAMQMLNFDFPISDLYYSCLDGTWNADGDAFFGEPPAAPGAASDEADLVSEVYLGRAPVSTSAEAKVFVDKTLGYELPVQQDFQHKILFLAEVLFPTNYDPQGPPPSADGAEYAEEVAHLLPAGMQVRKLYEATQLWEGSEPLTRLGATQAIDAGNGTVVHVGHGFRYTLSLGDASLTVREAAELVNGPRAGLFYMLNCTATAFDFESMAETLLHNPDGGATVVIGATREAFPATARTYQLAFFDKLFVQGERRVGVAMTESRHQLLLPFLPAVELWTQLVYTLLGDPELGIATRVEALQVEGVPASLHVGPQQVSLTVHDAQGPLDRALVCFSKPGDEYRVARTGANGVVVLDVEPGTAGTLDLTVTGYDHLPYRATLPVTLAGAGLTLASTQVSDDGGGSGTGNQDGRLDAGETATLRLILHNSGNTTRTGIAATLTTTDPAVTILQGTSAYPNLAASQEAAGVSPFVVRLAPSVSDGSVVTMSLAVQYASGSASHRVELLVRAASPLLANLRLDDSRAGNGNGVQEAGEAVDLFYRLENRGGGTALQVSLALVAVDPTLETLVDSVTVADIPPGATVEIATPLVVREPDTELSRPAELWLRHLQNAEGSFIAFDLRRPEVPTGLSFASSDASDVIQIRWNPVNDFDRLGYHVHRADAPAGPFVRVDTDLPLHGTYRDVGLAPSHRYYYRVTALDRTFLEGDPSLTVSVSTNPPLVSGWPNDANDFSASTPGVADVDGDGGLDVVVAAKQVLAWDAHGIELRDADQNAATWGVLYGHGEVFGPVAIADLDRAPGREIVVATWDPISRFVTVVNGEGADLPGWPRPLAPAAESHRGSQVPPVVANLDDRGAPEILLAARDGRLYGWHADGSEIADGDASAATQGVLFDTGSPFLRCAPAVAPLDPSSPGQEIVFGGTNGKLYVLDAQGRPLPGWPRTAPLGGDPFGTVFASGICIADLERDGQREMVFLESSGRLHAMHTDGSELPGFPVGGIQALSGSVVPSPALGNLQGDGALEIVVGGSDGRIHVFDAHGIALLPQPFFSGAVSESSPLLGDVDGDGEIEILFGNENAVLHAWNLDGSEVDGFPIALGAELRATPTLEDVNGDGNADLLAQSWEGRITLWDLGVPWVPSRFPWPTHRGSIHRTGEYGFAVPTPLALTDLHAVFEAGRGVWLSWRGGTEVGERQWRVRRAGPFAAEPERGEAEWTQGAVVVATLRGHGELQCLDASAAPASWYGYLIEVEGEEGFRIAAVLTLFTAPASELRLHAAVPNPFNPNTRLAFDVPALAGATVAVAVRLDLIDARGRVVATPVRGMLRPGPHAIQWDGRDASGREAPSGVYVARLSAADRVVTRKLTLLR